VRAQAEASAERLRPCRAVTVYFPTGSFSRTIGVSPAMVCRVSVDDFHFQSVRIRLNDQPAYFGNWSGETDAEAPSDAPAESIFAAAEAGLASSRRLVVMPSIAVSCLSSIENDENRSVPPNIVVYCLVKIFVVTEAWISSQGVRHDFSFKR